MTGEFSADWLRLREPADADARAADLVDLVRPHLDRRRTARDRPATDLVPPHLDRRRAARDRPATVGLTRRQAGAWDRPIVIRDLGCGTGSLSRWLAPRLPGPQHWVLVDRDPALLERAAATLPRYAGDGAPVTVEARLGDVTALDATELAGTSLVTCSALLDLLTAGEVDAIADALAAGATPALFTLSVAGEVRFDPPEPLDRIVAAAFDDHQRRTVAGRRLLGPDAPDVAARALAARGAQVTVRPSPWRLGPDRAELAAAWLRGWTSAAVEHRPDLRLDAYVENRLATLAAGTVTITVGHRDLLARFRGGVSA